MDERQLAVIGLLIGIYVLVTICSAVLGTNKRRRRWWHGTGRGDGR